MQDDLLVLPNKLVVVLGILEADDGLALLDLHAQLPDVLVDVVVDLLGRVLPEGGFQ